MKVKYLPALVALGLSTSLLPAANIAWVSFHSADDTPSANAAAASFTNASDVGYTALLKANSHTVTRFLTVDNLDTALLPDGVTLVSAALNTNDLVIIGRAVGSGAYQDLNETAAWAAITKPVISMGGYINRANRLGFHTGDTIPDNNSSQMRLRSTFPGHPIFAGVSLNSTNLMLNPFSVRVAFTNTTTGVSNYQNGISVVTSPVIAGGATLATVGTPGDAAFGGMVIGEFPAGTTSQRGDVFAAKRLVFLSGSREAGITSEGAGIFDLQTDGAKLFLNAVTYLTSGQPSLPPQVLTPLVGATNLVEGDAWTFSANVFGDLPRTYQWYKDGLAVAAGTDATLVFPSLTASDAGAYQLYVTNSGGWATSTVASLAFATFPPASITNSLISYWPLDGVLGTKTIDLVSSYDMNLANLSGADVVAGKWGNAFQFNGTNGLLSRINTAGDALPIYQHPNFTVSLWVNGLTQTDHRVFSEGSTTIGNTLFNLGTHNTGADGTLDIFIRTDGGTASPNHAHSTGTAFDGTWHNVVYVQRDVGGGNIKAQVWIDGVLDPVAFTPVRPLSANTTSIGGILRAAPSAFFGGLIDEVAVWNRALSSNEVAILLVTAITNAPSRTQPLAINGFTADLPAVVSGGSTTLRWDVSKDASQVTITPFGDVTAQTSVGIGARVITNTQSTTYVLTVSRGVDTLSATTSVAVVEGVAPGWTVLDTFDQAQAGNLFDSGYWKDTSGNGGQVVTVNGNKALRATSAGISFLNLLGLSVQELQARTLFFRLLPGETNAAGVTNIVGLTDKSQRSYGDAFANIGPVLYPTPFTNDFFGILTNGWYVGARWNISGVIDYMDMYVAAPEPQVALEAGAVYNVWMDITNAPMADRISDTFTVYIQKEGGAARKVLFQDYISDRDFDFVEPVLGGMAPNLDKLVVMGNSATFSATFDDFYLSTTGYNSSVPKAYSIGVTPLGPLSVTSSGNQLLISWPDGTLQSAPNASGPFLDVPGNPTSPYPVTPSGERMFFRSRQ